MRSDLPPLKVGDPVMDAAQGRPMVVLQTPGETVETYDDYDLTENYGNEKFGVSPDDSVVICRYVSDVSGKPKREYAFPRSRLRLIDAHLADDGLRIYDRVAFDLLEALATATDAEFVDAITYDLRVSDVPVDENVLDAAVEFAKATGEVSEE